MRRRVRTSVAAFVATIAFLMTVTPVLAESYVSTASFWGTLVGACRTYHGSSIHIQLTTTNAGPNGTYTISVYRCTNGQQTTLVGAPGTCHYPGFCGFGWSIALNGLQYGFFFKKTSGDGFDIIKSDSVQMWST